jgi:hypothetical protein
MNNEPVAYINEADGLVCAKCFKPLTETLTDEQIGWFAKAYTDRNGKLHVIDFARAILRKAQEK